MFSECKFHFFCFFLHFKKLVCFPNQNYKNQKLLICGTFAFLRVSLFKKIAFSKELFSECWFHFRFFCRFKILHPLSKSKYKENKKYYLTYSCFFLVTTMCLIKRKIFTISKQDSWFFLIKNVFKFKYIRFFSFFFFIFKCTILLFLWLLICKIKNTHMHAVSTSNVFTNIH